MNDHALNIIRESGEYIEDLMKEVNIVDKNGTYRITLSRVWGSYFIEVFITGKPESYKELAGPWLNIDMTEAQVTHIEKRLAHAEEHFGDIVNDIELEVERVWLVHNHGVAYGMAMADGAL